MSIAAFKRASERDGLLIFATQEDDSNMEPTLSDLREVGTLAKILSVNLLPNGSLRVLAEGKRRVRILRKKELNGNGESDIQNQEKRLKESFEKKLRESFETDIQKHEKELGENDESDIQKQEKDADGRGIQKQENRLIKNDESGVQKHEKKLRENDKSGIQKQEKDADEGDIKKQENRLRENEERGIQKQEKDADESVEFGVRSYEKMFHDAVVGYMQSSEKSADGNGGEVPEFLLAEFEEIVPTNETSVEADAYRRNVYELLDEYAAFDRSFQSETFAAIKAEKENNALIDKTAPLLSMKDAYPVLAERDTVKRFDLLFGSLSYELEVLRAEKKIHVKVKHSLDKAQKEHIMREQLRAISDELGEDTDSEIRTRIEALDAPDEVKSKLLKDNARLKKISAMSPEFSVITEYTEFALELPWNRVSDEIRDLAYAKEVLDRDHYGLRKVKERILEYIAVHKLTDSFRSPILCFIGPPGVGKTSVARSVADATGRKFVRMSLGGISDEAEIRGHRKTYVAAMAGRILNGIKLAGVSNPVFLLDEIDKLSKSNKGDPASALLEVLDPEQNSAFRDNYLELPYDLSKVMFLTTANSAEGIPEPLLDRMEIIRMPSYTYEEKFRIAKNHLVKKEMENHGLKRENIEIEDGAIYEIIAKYTSEPGVRELQRQIAKIMRKTAYAAASGGGKLTAASSNIAEFLGNKTVIRQTKRRTDEIGVVMGLAWTSGGGDILPIEINTVKGKGEVITTGNLQDIIKESIKVALTYIRSAAEKYGIAESAFKNLDYHIHLPETSVPKEGPSAGAGFAAAIYSALTKTPVRNDAAATGEISLRGNISAVGGIKEKIMSGVRAGIETFFIPRDNLPDTEEIPREIAEKIRIVPVSHFGELVESGLLFSRGERFKERDADGADAKRKGPVRSDFKKEGTTGGEDFGVIKGFEKRKTPEDGDGEDGGKVIIDGIGIDRIFGN
jgi:ATP-dependent Lon protease